MGKKKVAQQSDKEVLSQQEHAGAKTAQAVAVKKSKRIERGKIYIKVSYNNTLVTVTDMMGGIIAWASAGSLGFSGPKKATPFASSKVISTIAEKLKPLGLTTVDVFVKGVGGGRDSALRSLVNQGFTVASIKDITPIPHNGPRPKKVRRV
jgi:small subunit ribosomal protein S11